MRRNLLVVLILNSVLLPPSNSAANGPKEYKSKGGYRVVILPAGKPSDHADYESKMEFYSAANQMLCTLDYSSGDGEHGFGLVKAAWTPDNEYFVFSLTSSGGHQPWHAPTFFYSVRDNQIRSLDSFAEAAGISKSDFTLRFPNIVLTEVWRGQVAVPISFRLDSLTNARPTSQHPTLCTEGKLFQPER